MSFEGGLDDLVESLFALAKASSSSTIRAVR
jgi:hypothetical protein